MASERSPSERPASDGVNADAPTRLTIDPASAPEAVQRWLAALRPVIDAELGRHLDDGAGTGTADDPGRLREAMRYAALGPGKRLRPALVLAVAEALGGAAAAAAALPAAAAIELLHAYTLVHDDLPAMDDDDLRRGRPTVHVVFGEAIAILAGDGLLTAAFAALATLGPHAADAVAVLAARAGASALLAGQARDLAAAAAADAGAADAAPSLVALERMHAEKTGALFAAAAELGAIAAGADAATRASLARYGMAIGIAFQHADDRDDGEHATHAAAAAQRMIALAEEALAIVGALRTRDRDDGSGRAALVALATWIRGRA